MKKLLSSVAVVLALSFGTSAPTLAEVVTNVSIPFNATIANACLGEPVALTGDLHLLIKMQERGDGDGPQYQHQLPAVKRVYAGRGWFPDHGLTH